MSWSLSAVLTDKQFYETGLDSLVPSGNDQAIEERDRQVKAAKEAVITVLNSMVFNEASEIVVVMNGHANPGHKKDSAWSNDFISISLNVKKYVSEEEAAV